MRESIGKAIYTVFGWGIYVCLIAGGVSFFGFLASLVLGGDTGRDVAVFLQKQYFPVVIRFTSFFIILGLIGMYINKQQALSMAADKASADKDIAMSKRLQRKDKAKE